MSYVFENNHNNQQGDTEGNCFQPITLSGLISGVITFFRG